MNTFLDAVLTLRDEYIAYRAARAQHKQLVRELSAYTSLSDRLEIDAIVARYPEEDTVEVRRILVSLPA